MHIWGVHTKDKKGWIYKPQATSEKLKNFINDHLEAEPTINGKVLRVITIPDYIEYFNIELQKQDYQDLKMLMVGDNEPFLRWKLYPKKWRTQDYYDE